MIALLAIMASAVHAQSTETDYDRLDARGFWVADTASEPNRPLRLAYPAAGGGWDAGLMVDVARAPLREAMPEGTEPIIDVFASAHAYGGVVWKGMRFDLGMPATLYGRDPGGGFAGAGDLRLGAMLPAREPQGAWPGVGLQLSTWLPTGTAQRWSGSPGVAAGAVACLAQEIGPFGWTANAGLRIARSEEARNLVAGGGPIGGFEAHYSVVDAVALGAGVAVQGATGFATWPVEATARVSYRTRGGGFAFLGFGQGITNGVGASAGRVYFGAGYGVRPPSEPPAAVVVPVVLHHRRILETAPEEAPVAMLVDDRIVVSEQVFFREARAELLPESDRVLAAVKGVLDEHPEIGHLLVEGHTNSRGSQRYNRRLSDARAQAVVDWMVAHGTDSDRLLAKGLGEQHPLLPDDHQDAMIVNRRVEFTVLRSDEDDVQPRVPAVDELPAEARRDP